MSELWDKGKKIELPNPELNPLQNPTLGKNLGRWAQVYFTSPPEKREQAVVDLLRELESETGPRPPRLEETLPLVKPVVPRLICKNCQQPNELDQRFCGLCGTPLRSADAPMREPPRTVMPTVELRRGAEPVFTAPSDTTEENDLQWLREKSLSRLSDPDDESSGKWKYILIAVVLVAAAFGTLQWVASRPVTNAPAPAATAAPVQPQTTQPAPATTPPPARMIGRSALASSRAACSITDGSPAAFFAAPTKLPTWPSAMSTPGPVEMGRCS